MKYVSIRIPDCGPFGDTLFEASDAAICGARFLNNPFGGCVESVLTVLTHFLFVRRAMLAPHSTSFTSLQSRIPAAAISRNKVLHVSVSTNE
jgi:hypothetical protein